jgi:prophage regulatory protein
MPAPTGLPETGFVRMKALLACGAVPVARGTLYRWIAAGAFPRPVKLGPGVSAWRVEDVRAWIARQSADPS